jgi:hypothetical protein
VDFQKELALLQEALADADFSSAIQNMREDNERGLHYLLVKVLKPIRIKIDGSRNHKRPHIHIDYGKQFHAASYAIDTGERLVGESKYDREVAYWINENKPKLLEAWQLVQAGKDATPIAQELRGE